MPNRIAIAALLALVLVPQISAQRRPARDAGPPVKGATEDGVSVYFSPDGGALATLRAAVMNARKSIGVQAYILTTKEIAGPLAEAHKRGVKLRVLMDSDNAGKSYSAATYLPTPASPSGSMPSTRRRTTR